VPARSIAKMNSLQLVLPSVYSVLIATLNFACLIERGAGVHFQYGSKALLGVLFVTLHAVVAVATVMITVSDVVVILLLFYI